MAAYERIIHGYVHNARVGVLVEIGAETDFATRSAEFIEFAHDVALHIAASAPESVSDLLSQPFVKNEDISVGALLARIATQLREQVEIVRFVRWDTSVPAVAPEPPSSPAIARRA
jgi:elongation factor Ts